MRRVASKPLRMGMLMSIRMTCGGLADAGGGFASDLSGA